MFNLYKTLSEIELNFLIIIVNWPQTYGLKSKDNCFFLYFSFYLFMDCERMLVTFDLLVAVSKLEDVI